MPRQTQMVAAISAFVLFLYLFIDPTPKEYGLGQNLRYGIIFDAGSSGSRVHVYTFEERDGEFDLLNEDFEMLEPGLSAFPDDPKAAWDSLAPLIEVAYNSIPKEKWRDSPVVLRATAGLRLLGETKSKAILDQVRKGFKKLPFKFRAGGVAIMDGSDEGLYAWVTVNYLKKTIGLSPMKTSGVLDLGGGSTQIAFAVTAAEAKLVPDYVVDKKFGSTKYHLYVHSYLGYGLNSARNTIFEQDNNQEPQFCVPPNYVGTWNELTVVGKSEEAILKDPSQCQKQVSDSLFQKKKVECPADRCEIGGIPQPNTANRHFHAFSFYYDRAIDLGILKEDNPVLTPGNYKKAAEDVCALTPDTIKSQYTVEKAKDLPFQCVDHSYIYKLLHSLGFGDNQKLTLTKKINDVETGWCLGAMIEELMS